LAAECHSILVEGFIVQIECPTLEAANSSIRKLTVENNKLKELIKNTIWYVKTNEHTTNVRELVLHMLAPVG